MNSIRVLASLCWAACRRQRLFSTHRDSCAMTLATMQVRVLQQATFNSCECLQQALSSVFSLWDLPQPSTPDLTLSISYQAFTAKKGCMHGSVSLPEGSWRT